MQEGLALKKNTSGPARTSEHSQDPVMSLSCILMPDGVSRKLYLSPAAFQALVGAPLRLVKEVRSSRS